MTVPSNPKRAAALFVLAVLLLGTADPARAAGVGYWQCEAGTWVQHGKPDHPMPSMPCGFKLSVPKEEAACLARGGDWKRVGIFPAKVCVLPTGDGGHVCGDDGECEAGCIATLDSAERQRVSGGNCVVRTGTCAPAVPVVGCHGIVEQGQVCRFVCRD